MDTPPSMTGTGMVVVSRRAGVRLVGNGVCVGMESGIREKVVHPVTREATIRTSEIFTIYTLTIC
jgi:hypothetical protein